MVSSSSAASPVRSNALGTCFSSHSTLGVGHRSTDGGRGGSDPIRFGVESRMARSGAARQDSAARGGHRGLREQSAEPVAGQQDVPAHRVGGLVGVPGREDRKSTRLNSSHVAIAYAVFCLKKKKRPTITR